MINVKELDPRVKLTWCLFLILTALVSQSMVQNGVLLFCIVVIEIMTQKSLQRLKVPAILLLLVGSQILIINLLFGRAGTLLFSWGFLSIYSGFISAAIMGFLRISVISLGAIQFACNTDATDIAQMLIKWHVPYRYAMLVPITARFFPVMVNEYKSICDSHSVRGVPCDTVMEHIKNLPAAMLPLIYRALRISNDASLSIELRGYGRYDTRSFNKPIEMSAFEGIAILLIIIAYISLMLYTVFL